MTVDTEITTTSETTTPEAAVPAVAQREIDLRFDQNTYVCKKHVGGVAYISIDGSSFCSLCLKRFLERYVKPMTKLETKAAAAKGSP